MRPSRDGLKMEMRNGERKVTWQRSQEFQINYYMQAEGSLRY